jgi:hypothetical protein
MKKIFFSAAIALSLVALAASPDQSKKSNSSLCANTITDTVPGKKDTTRKPIPDSIQLQRP